MRYAIYVVFIFWYFAAVWSLVVGLGYVVSGQRSPGRPLWYYFFSFVAGVAVTSVLLWLYSSEVLGEMSTLIIGTLVFLPDVYFVMRSHGSAGIRNWFSPLKGIFGSPTIGATRMSVALATVDRDVSRKETYDV